MTCSEAHPGSQITLRKKVEAAQYFSPTFCLCRFPSGEQKSWTGESFWICIFPPSSAFDSELSEMVGSVDGWKAAYAGIYFGK